MKQIAQGAEAIIYLSPSSEISAPNKSASKARQSQGGWEGAEISSKNIIIKNRTPKSYRHPTLDNQIRKSRTKKETKLLNKATKIINTPSALNQDKFTIQMQYINGERLSETLNSKPQAEQFKIMQQIGEQIAKLHNNNIIHGDLTTSNTILLNEKQSKDTEDSTINGMVGTFPGKVFLIDFGLGFISTRIEDKAVDIHLIRQALEAKHFQNHEQLFEQLLKSYQPKERDKILEQLKKVEARGRYK